MRLVYTDSAHLTFYDSLSWRPSGVRSLKTWEPSLSKSEARMKGKPACSADIPFSLVEDLNENFIDWLFENVIVATFHADANDTLNWGPAACYAQFCDFFSARRGSAINFNLSGVTLRPDRNFEEAKRLIREELTRRIRRHWKGVSVHTMIVIHASSPDGDKAPLLEEGPFFVDTRDLRPSCLEALWRRIRIGWRKLCHK